MSRIKDAFLNVQTLFLAVTIILGTLYLFWGKLFPPEPEPRAPRAEVSHQIFSTCIDSTNRWARAMVEVRNIGQDSLKLAEGMHQVRELLPANSRLVGALAAGRPVGNERGTIDWSRFAESRKVSAAGAASEESRTETPELASNEAFRDYLDILISPEAEVIEVTSHFRDQESGDSGPLWQGSAKTIYAIREDVGCKE